MRKVLSIALMGLIVAGSSAWACGSCGCSAAKAEKKAACATSCKQAEKECAKKKGCEKGVCKKEDAKKSCSAADKSCPAPKKSCCPSKKKAK